MIETILFKEKCYPKFQSTGFAARFIFPFAQEVCKGDGLDIGCNREEWCFPGAMPIDPVMNGYNAMHLPEGSFDYIFSSHCLEHIDDWVGALNYWTEKLKSGGTLFLYLPHPSQRYWNPWHNRKHIHLFYPGDIEQYLVDSNLYRNIFVSCPDLNNSFVAMAEKK